ncbi:MAG: hypothetical protein E6R08_10080 [Nevskiaceae bacterium]|nr:MAG: hypothetical protein E6R08_10080 [Nevskiaceae bacterium]
MAWTLDNLAKRIEALSADGVIGFYRSYEVTIFYLIDANQQVHNLLTILVAEPYDPSTPVAREYLTPTPRSIRGLPGRFGIRQCRIPMDRLTTALEAYAQAPGSLNLAGAPMTVGTLAPVAPQFIPGDSSAQGPINDVLKNNFFSGSHLLELADTTKNTCLPLLNDPAVLARVVAEIPDTVPIGLDGVSDRLGNILIQFPVTVAEFTVRGSAAGELVIDAHWDPRVTPRPLRAQCAVIQDGGVQGFQAGTIDGNPLTLPMHDAAGEQLYVVWDDTAQAILTARQNPRFIKQIGFSMDYGGAPDTRTFMPDGATPVAVQLVSPPTHNWTVGTTETDPREPWRSRRLFKTGLQQALDRLEFVQYGGQSGRGRAEALEDIRALIRNHGKNGAWLWDPYLSGRDVLDTLFYCPHKSADLRALSAGNQDPQAPSLPAQQIQANWRKAIEDGKGDCQDLTLDYRMRIGTAGWPFHDRFLIFPSTEYGALAWSLGTSVNGLGKDHHILQKVTDGERVRQAFLDLWDALSDPQYRVWSHP